MPGIFFLDFVGFGLQFLGGLEAKYVFIDDSGHIKHVGKFFQTRLRGVAHVRHTEYGRLGVLRAREHSAVKY